jgi:hypothetical protein
MNIPLMSQDDEYFEERRIITYDDIGRIRKDKGSDTITLEVYSEENQPIPHFHFYHGKGKIDKGKKKLIGGGCIMITEPRYFSHSTHTDTLNSDEIDILTHILDIKFTLGNTTDNIWNLIVEEWNYRNDKFTIDQDIIDQGRPLYEYGIRAYKEK